MSESAPVRVIQVTSASILTQASLPTEGLLLANLSGDRPIAYYGSILLSREQGVSPMPAEADAGVMHFDEALEQGNFCIEVPSENFLSAVITEKLRKTPAEERAALLAVLMHEKGISRVLVVHPVKSS